MKIHPLLKWLIVFLVVSIIAFFLGVVSTLVVQYLFPSVSANVASEDSHPGFESIVNESGTMAVKTEDITVSNILESNTLNNTLDETTTTILIPIIISTSTTTILPYHLLPYCNETQVINGMEAKTCRYSKAGVSKSALSFCQKCNKD